MGDEIVCLKIEVFLDLVLPLLYSPTIHPFLSSILIPTTFQKRNEKNGFSIYQALKGKPNLGFHIYYTQEENCPVFYR
jgi:hypothetical protein